ncbi:MAG: hypothetical protein ABEJ57_06495 [Halobacteriaceae archaeon]
MAPRGIFGIPHGILSSTDERIAFLIGLVALAAAILYNGELNMRPVRGAAAVGIVVAVLGSFAAPAAIANEWHIPVLVVLVVSGAVAYSYRHTGSS